MNEIYQKIEEREKDHITYSTLIKGYAKEKNMEKMNQIYEHMKNTRMILDEVLYNTLLDGFAKTGNLEKVTEIITEMKNHNIIFSNVTYSILIKLYSKNSNMKKVFELFEEMKRKNITPGLIVYTCLIQSCIRLKDLSKAIELFETMKKQKIQPDHILFSSMINGCLFNNRYESAYKYMVDSINLNMKLLIENYEKFFSMVVSKHCNEKNSVKLKFVEKVYSLLREKNVILSDDSVKKVSNFICKVKEISSRGFKTRH